MDSGLLAQNDGHVIIREIGVGDAPRLSLSQSGDSLMLVHANAYCWISEQHLKRPLPATCQAKGRTGVESVDSGMQPGSVGAEAMCGAPLAQNDVLLDS